MFHHVRPWREQAFAPNRGLEITPEFLEATIETVRARGFERRGERVDLGGRRARELQRSSGVAHDLNNMLGEEDLRPSDGSALAPGQRMGSMMAPTLVHLADGSRAVLGTAVTLANTAPAPAPVGRAQHLRKRRSKGYQRIARRRAAGQPPLAGRAWRTFG